MPRLQKLQTWITLIVIIGLIRVTICEMTGITRVISGTPLSFSAVFDYPNDNLGNVSISINETTVFTTRGGCSFTAPYDGIVQDCDALNQRVTITFPSVTSAHSGTWQVKTQPETPVSQSINVLVVWPPTNARVEPTDTTAGDGADVKLTCTVDAVATQPVNFTWKRLMKYSRIDPSLSAIVSTDSNGLSSHLHWYAIDQEDDGEYVCQISNEFGIAEISATIRVRVIGPTNSYQPQTLINIIIILAIICAVSLVALIACCVQCKRTYRPPPKNHLPPWNAPIDLEQQNGGAFGPGEPNYGCEVQRNGSFDVPQQNGGAIGPLDDDGYMVQRNGSFDVPQQNGGAIGPLEDESVYDEPDPDHVYDGIRTISGELSAHRPYFDMTQQINEREGQSNPLNMNIHVYENAQPIRVVRG